MTEIQTTERTRVKRGQKRATFDKASIHTIIDEALLCHVGTQLDDRPMVQPTVHWRIDDHLYIHGSSKNGLFKGLSDGREACITITHLDGLVMARSSFHHSMNYRSVMIFSSADIIHNEREKLNILNEMMKKITPDRFNDIREPNPQELKATMVLQFSLNELSAKVRTGPPVDDESDLELPVWAGVIPTRLMRETPVSDPIWIEKFS